jgi:hypothetical protein
MGKSNASFYVGLLPEEGIVYVAASAVSWDGMDSENQNFIEEKEGLERLASLGKTFVRRGFVSTTSSILKKIKKSISYYESQCKELDREISELKCSNSYYVNFLIDERDKASKWLSEYRNVYSSLEEGTRCYGCSGEVRKEHAEIVARGLNNLSDSKKQFVVEAAVSGSGNGIFSDDDLVIEGYSRLVAKFCLEDCFVCDPITFEVEKVSR